MRSKTKTTAPELFSKMARRLPTTIAPALVALGMLLGAATLSAQAPAGYYNTVDATNATALRQTLHDVIDDHTRFPYTASTTDTWDILNLADEDPNNTSNIIDLYKNASYTKMAGGVGAYNREHSWPKSYGFPDDNPDNYPYTDTHHLFVCDVAYNATRSNMPFRSCDASCFESPTDFNDGRGGGSGFYPGNSNWDSGSFTQGTWETWDGRKGDVARAIFYMDIRYEGGNHGITGSAEPDLIVTDSETLIDSGNTGSNESVAYMGMLSVLLQWHAQDPPDSREIWRNEVVFSFQGNRNPFIDHPEWADCLHSNVCGGGDTTPPAAPTGLVASAGTGSVDLIWNANAENDLDGYHVYRATSSGGPYARITGTLLSNAFYTDSGLSGGTAFFYVVSAVDTSANESGNSSEASATPSGGGGGGGNVVLSEVIYDVSSSDNGFEWVELFNSGTSAVNLSGFCLANGGTTYTASTVQLSGIVAPGATFVVGGPTSSAANANPSFDQVLNFSPDFQNSGSTADGVALFDVPCAQVNSSTVPVDAVIYGGSNNSGLIDETGVANAPEVGDASAGSSLERIDLAGAWQIQGNPTPNSSSLAPPVVNTAPNVNISAPTNGSSVSEGSSISFGGSASDTEDGSLTANLSWTSSLDGAIGSGGAFSTVLSVGIHTVTASVTDSGGLSGSDVVSVTVQATAPTSGSLLLSEVLYDTSGSDDTLEWIEIYNNDTVAIDLSGFSLGNGGLAYTSGLMQLSGLIQPGATFVVGGPTSSSANGNPTYDLAANFNPDLQNSGRTGDGVALFNVPASAVTASTVPIDAVIYGPNNNNGLIDESGSASASDVGDAPSGSSIERVDLAGSWQIQGSPTPNASPLASGPTETTFISVASHDGWVRESSENSNLGGSRSSTSTSASALRAGDNRSDRQYKGVVSFDTSSIPNGATIVSATLRLRRGTVVGTNPFNTHGTCWVDVHSGGLGSSTSLANSDFQAVADVARSASLSNAAVGGDWSEGSLDPVGLTAVNKTGTTQLRFYFNLGDNDDRGNDYIGYYSSNNSNAANHPQLVVTYQE